MALRRAPLISICLSLLLALPQSAGATPRKKKKTHSRSHPAATQPEKPEEEPDSSGQPTPEPASKVEPGETGGPPSAGSETAAPVEATTPSTLAHRAEQALRGVLPAPVEAPLSRQGFAFAGGGAFLVAGLAFGYSAQGETKRAETISNAREASRTLDGARAAAATANVLYGLAGVSTLYALALLVLPEPTAQKASLSFHF